MKKGILFLFILLSLTGTLAAKEYSYLNPPTISVMDFEVTIEEPVVQENYIDKAYYGQLVNHTLVTMLIRKNTARDVEVGIARYFPTLLKIYDKKYVESALQANNFSVGDLYQKNSEAFNYADLDFVVLGNVYETKREKQYIGINVRVLNTYRGEELFSYIGLIDIDLSNLYEVCGRISENIIVDILKNYCSQVIIKETRSTDMEFRVPSDADYLLFCQSKQEWDNENAIISTNDTFKKTINGETFYWILPGDYIITVYNKPYKSVAEIPVTINPREIKLIELRKEHFLVDTGTITIQNVFPVDAFGFIIKEKVRDAEYIWEIGMDLGEEVQEHRVTFRRGDFDSASESELGPRWVYKAATNEIIISNISLSKYDIRVAPVAESISKESITGIAKIALRRIETSAPIEVDLKRDREVVLNIDDFGVRKDFEVEAFKKTRVTFLMQPAFSRGYVELEVNDGDTFGYLLLTNIEKLVIEDEYNQEDWGDTLKVSG